jgi:general secretion pathway protein K
MKPVIGTAMTSQTASDGFIVVAVLWILSALAALVSVYSVFVIDTATAFKVHDDRLRAEGLVSAAIELAAYQITTTSESHPSRGQFGFRMGSANLAVELRSEAARIDLNAAPKEVLIGLFATLGAPADDAENYAKRVIGWRTAPSKDRDSEALAYRTAGLKYLPRGNGFAHAGELSLVLNLPTVLVERALPCVTVYSGRPQVNILDAAPEVIAALPGMTRDRFNSFIAQRQATPENGQLLMSLLGPVQGYATTARSKTWRVIVRIVFDDGQRAVSEVVILMFEEGNEPYSVLSWRDEPDRLYSDDRTRWR